MNSGLVGGQEKAFDIKRIKGTIRFDGIPDDEPWKEVDKFDLTMWRPNFGARPSEESDVRIGYDNEYLWIGASLLMEDASRIFVATKRRDEMLWDYDAFGIILDTWNDNENGLAFFTNPAGLRTDYAVSNDASGAGGFFTSMNISWDTFWDVKTTTDDKGWYLEMRIPFSSLKFRTVDGIATMGLIINRSISSNNETDLFPSIDPRYGYSAMMKPSQAVKIRIDGAKPEKPIYVSPYIIGGLSRDQVMNDPETNYVKKDSPEYNAGLDIKFNINSNLTLDLTANTDFAQVEADDQQVNLTRYSLFFPEKRKFFQERSGLFDFSLGGFADNLFYSRNIGIANGNPVKIYGGARLTGRFGRWDMGFLDMQTAEDGETPGMNYGVLRMRRQVINQNSYVGGIFTSRAAMNGENNFAYGVDGIFKLFGDDYLNVKWAQSYDSKTDSRLTSIDPAFFLVNWERRSQKGLGYNFNYNYSGREFNPGIGFVMRHGVQGGSASILYGWLPGEKSKLFRYSINLRSNIYSRLDDGGIESLSVSPSFEFGTKNGIFGQVGMEFQKEGVLFDYHLSDSVKVYSGDYSFLGTRFMLGTSNTRKISVMANTNIGQFYDGIRFGFTAGPEFNLSSSLNFTLMYSFNAIRFPERESNSSLDIHSVNLRASYMMSTKLTATFLVQYVNTRNDLVTNFRVRYNPREGNDFYIVYNDYRGLFGGDLTPRPPDFYNKTIMVKYVHTFIL